MLILKSDCMAYYAKHSQSTVRTAIGCWQQLKWISKSEISPQCQVWCVTCPSLSLPVTCTFHTESCCSLLLLPWSSFKDLSPQLGKGWLWGEKLFSTLCRRELKKPHMLWSVVLLSNLLPFPVTKSLVFLPIVSLGTTFVSIFSRGKYCSLMLCTLTGTSRDVGAVQNMSLFVM